MTQEKDKEVRLPDYIVRFGTLTVNTQTRVAIVSGTKVDLTQTERRVITFLAERAGVFVSQGSILAAAYPEGHLPEVGSVKVHISKIRKKLDALGAVACLESRRGVGYRMRKSAR